MFKEVRWLRTNGVNTNGAAANVINLARLGRKVRPGTFEKIEVGERGYPESPSVKKNEICSYPISAGYSLSDGDSEENPLQDNN